MVRNMTTDVRKPRRVAPLDHDPESLRWAREQGGWKQAPLARAAGIPKSVLCEAEKGERGLSDAAKARIAELLGCPISVFDRKQKAAA